MHQVLNDRFEIESIRQEQGYFKQKLASIKNDINVMKQLHETGRTAGSNSNQFMQTVESGRSNSNYMRL